MEVIKQSIVPFLLSKIQAESEETPYQAALLKFLNVVVCELFEKIRDIYCVLESVHILRDQILSQGLRIDVMRTKVFSNQWVTKLLTSISSPNLHVPQYNFKTRSAVYKIYEMMSLNRSDLLEKLDPSLYVSCILSAVDGEGDPRNLLVVYDLLHFILLNFCQENSESIEKG